MIPGGPADRLVPRTDDASVIADLRAKLVESMRTIDDLREAISREMHHRATLVRNMSEQRRELLERLNRMQDQAEMVDALKQRINRLLPFAHFMGSTNYVGRGSDPRGYTKHFVSAEMRMADGTFETREFVFSSHSPEEWRECKFCRAKQALVLGDLTYFPRRSRDTPNPQVSRDTSEGAPTLAAGRPMTADEVVSRERERAPFNNPIAEAMVDASVAQITRAEIVKLPAMLNMTLETADYLRQLINERIGMPSGMLKSAKDA